MFYLDNDYCGVSEVLEGSKVKKADVSNGQVTLTLENGAKVFIKYEECEGLNITASSD